MKTQNNELPKDIPSWLADLISNDSLEIEEVSASDILPHLGKLGQLRKLTLTYVDDLTDLPLSLTKLKNLEELNIEGADFKHFPSVIASLTSLQSFSYINCNCPLPEVFNALSALPQLKKLRFTHHADKNGDFLPESFGHLQAIEELHFNDWPALRELPECIGDMRNLRIINLSHDDHQLYYDIAMIQKLPDSLGNISKLEELDIFGLDNLKHLPSSFKRLSNLKRLDTVCSGIDELHLTPEQWNNLEGLCMHGPLPDMRQCANLKQFYYFKNGVGSDASGIPFGIYERISMPITPLRKLESLQIMGGALGETDFLASLTNLRSLFLYCDFKSFPKGFENLNKLEEISIQYAKSLVFLPEYLGHMPSLKKLRLDRCGVKELPKSVRERSGLVIDVR